MSRIANVIRKIRYELEFRRERKLNSVLHIINPCKMILGEDRSCGCEHGTYCGDELYVEDGETLCGEYIGEYSNIRSVWHHWVNEDTKTYGGGKMCNKCQKRYPMGDCSDEKEIAK